MPSQVLLASYDSHLLQTAGQALKAEHIETLFADDGQAALCLLNEALPDVLIADIALPGKDGYALCRYVRQEPEFESLAVVLLDSRFDAINRENALKLGADVYLSQPFALSELIAVVHQLLESREGSREAGDDQAAAVAVWPADGGRPTDEVPVAMQAGAQLPLGESALAAIAGEPRLPSLPPAALPRQRPRDAWMFYAVAAVAMLIGIVLAILLRTQPTEVQSRAPEPGSGKSAPEPALARAGQPYPDSAAALGGKLDMGLGVAPPVSVIATNPATHDAGAQAAQAAPLATAKSPGKPPAAEARQSESSPATAAARQASPAPPGHRPPDTPAPARRIVRSNTKGYQWRRSGQEIVLAGEHFGSSAKHFGKGSAKTVGWAGKQAGSGIKRIGGALKRIF